MDRAIGAPLPTWRVYCDICEDTVATHVVYADALDLEVLPDLGVGDPIYICAGGCWMLYGIAHAAPGSLDEATG